MGVEGREVLPDQLIIPIGEFRPGLTITAADVVAMAAERRRVPIMPKGCGPVPALGYFTAEARADGLWATKIELTPDGAPLTAGCDLWLAGLFELGGRDEMGEPIGARLLACEAVAGLPPWRAAP